MRTAQRPRAARTAVIAASLAGLVGGAVVLAPSASAVGVSACQSPHKENERVTQNMNFRTGPGTKYTSRGIVTRQTTVYVACLAKGYGYVKPTEGAWKGKVGWVSASYLTGMFNL